MGRLGAGTILKYSSKIALRQDGDDGEASLGLCLLSALDRKRLVEKRSTTLRVLAALLPYGWGRVA